MSNKLLIRYRASVYVGSSLIQRDMYRVPDQTRDVQSSNVLRNLDQQLTPGLPSCAVVEMKQSIARPQSVQSDAGPSSHGIRTDFVVLDFEAVVVCC